MNPLRVRQSTAPASLFEHFIASLSVDNLVHLLSYVSLAQILALEATSVRAYQTIQTYREEVWNIDAHLSPWFPDPKEFRSLLGDCNAVVSGSHVLQFLERSKYLGSDIDIFISLPGVLRMGLWLRDCLGYKLNWIKPWYFDATVEALCDRVRRGVIGGGILTVFEFVRYVGTPSASVIQQRVQLIVVNGEPFQFVALNFHSSGSRFFLSLDLLTMTSRLSQPLFSTL